MASWYLLGGHHLLPVYVSFETCRSLVSYAALHSEYAISPTFITLSSEICKAITAIALLCIRLREKEGLSFSAVLTELNLISDGQPEGSRWRAYLTWAIPSLLYLANNLLYLVGLQVTSPVILSAAVTMKLPITAILHHFLIAGQRNIYAWASLVALCAGLIIVNIPSKHTKPTNLYTHTTIMPDYLLGPLIGLAIATISGLTSVYTEILLKRKIPFWTSQVWLYGYGTLFAAAAFVVYNGPQTLSLTAIHDHFPSVLTNLVNLVVVSTTAATGLIVANILRKKDNLVKLVGTAISIVTILFTQVLFIPELRAKTLSVQTVAGAGIIAISTWTYHYYKQAPPDKDYSLLQGQRDLEDSDSEIGMREKPKVPSESMITPTRSRIILAAGIIAFLTAVVAVFDHSV